MSETDWLVDSAAIGPVRAKLLVATSSFEEVLYRIKGRDTSPRARREPGNLDGPFEGAYRFHWSITPRDKGALDLFFNGKFGYRAAYSVGPAQGDEANDMAMQVLSSWLRDLAGAPIGESQHSSVHAGGKLWVPADDRIHCALFTGRIYKAEILQPTWTRAADDQIAVARGKGDHRFFAAAGQLAPIPKVLQVIGPWVRDGHVVEPIKSRSVQIHMFGYT